VIGIVVDHSRVPMHLFFSDVQKIRKVGEISGRGPAKMAEVAIRARRKVRGYEIRRGTD
jgi:hypothetical protein